MRVRVGLVVLALVLIPAASAAAFRVAIVAPTHFPKANAKWFYSVRVTDAHGKPLVGTITVQIADPFGGLHPVQFGDTTRTIVNRPFSGTFRDFIRFPPESRGLRLTVRAIVTVRRVRTVTTYWITAK
jgi:hypothetical protein